MFVSVPTCLDLFSHMERKKRPLCAFDDKRYRLDDRIRSLAFGHHEIQLD